MYCTHHQIWQGLAESTFSEIQGGIFIRVVYMYVTELVQPKVVEHSWSNQPSARGMSGDATRKLCRPCLHTLHTCSSEPCTIYWPPIHDHGQTHRSACEMWEALISWLNTIWWLLKVRQRLIFSNEPACGCQWEMGAEGVGALVRLLQGKIFHFSVF